MTFATGMAVCEAAEEVVKIMKGRAAKIWEIDYEAVEWKDGSAYPAGDNAGKFEPLSLADIAAKAGRRRRGVRSAGLRSEGQWDTHGDTHEIKMRRGG